ncbi:hypothetical protein LUX33_05505 [Actinomadura madurae]|uniref:hypothetical protein n=1 Tax=Actinomadura madurae TaxID=1993 RepID=UPI0020D2614F|nr:hypothetical protein [Actinomadura madurae]MCP9947928.1 hypothetical protein [Actinomadura madurae]
MSFTAVVSGETAITARGPLKEDAERVLGRLWIDQVPVRLASEDASLWPSAATAGVDGRPLCWPGQPGPGRAVLDRAEELRAHAREAGLTEVVLLGGGAPARAAELIVNAHRGAAARARRRSPCWTGPNPGRCCASGRTGSGSTGRWSSSPATTPGTETLRQVFAEALADHGLSPAEAERRFVTVAEPGAAAAKHAMEAGHPLVEAPAATAFGALSPYALVPAALAGVGVRTLLEEATAVLPSLTRPENNPGLVLGAILGGAVRAGRRAAVLGGGRRRCPASPGGSPRCWRRRPAAC